MPPKTRSTASGTGKTVPALVNNGYFSEYYLAYRLDAGLDELFKRWDAAEKEGSATARTRVRSLTTALDKYRLDAALTAPDAMLDLSAGDDASPLDGPLDLRRLPSDGAAAERDLNDALLAALGWTPGRDRPLELISGDCSFTVPVAARCETHAGTVLVALETVFATDPATIVTSKQAAAGTLLDPVRRGDRIEARTALEAVQVIFTADAPPNYVLVVSGGSISLLDRDRWGEGVYLAANIDDALARHDVKPRGELAALAALFSADSINPGEGAQSVLAALLEKAATEAAGVSKELRYGVRRSVELLANAVVRDVRERQHSAWRSIDPKDLTRQCLRYLYRIIVLLFAEARPELGILPVDDSDYQTGYSLARLREVALRGLHTDQGRNATHVQDSLTLLFRLVNDGYEPEATLTAGDDVHGLSFRALRSALFSPDACPLIDRARIPDSVLQSVIEHLCFSREKSGRQRQSLSYATLGINQLGAVYEGLMSYSGFLATEPLLEIARDGEPDKGSWVIPAVRAEEFPANLFVEQETSDGSLRHVRYEAGDFVFRLSGRDRQRSASYYTPETLTEFTVRHAVDEFFEMRPPARAADILAVTLCEPALGSGAFLNEAIRQVSVRYLKIMQEESGAQIDPDRYPYELQRVKAHFAVNQAFGVDLNRTAVELAEVSLWLSCMHQGLDAPWFGARLRRGNSLIGARRAVYTTEQVAAGAWSGKQAVAAVDLAMDKVPLGSLGGHVYHFLLPGAGWGSAVDSAAVCSLEPEWSAVVKSWRATLQRKPRAIDVSRLAGLSSAIDRLWARSADEIRAYWEVTRQGLPVWGASMAERGEHYLDSKVRRALSNPRSATVRLRTVMDAWCSFWVWGPENGADLPSADEWLTWIETMVDTYDSTEAGLLFTTSTEVHEESTTESNWLTQSRKIAEREGWFHWPLEFSPIVQAGGFDIVVGNPPWTKVSRTDTDVLLDAEPSWALFGPPGEPGEAATGRDRLLADPETRSVFLEEAARSEATRAFLGGRTEFPLTSSMLTNLYLCFQERTFSITGGVAGLIHQESFYEDPRGGQLRSEVYKRLRRHWHFVNEESLFEEVHNETEFGVHIYGQPGPLRHWYCSNALHPHTIDRSLAHDGEGPVPGKKNSAGEWDTRPHRDRCMILDESAFNAFGRLLGTAPGESPRPLRIYASDELRLLERLAQSGHRVLARSPRFSSGLHETSMTKEPGALMRKSVSVPAAIEAAIFKGPNINVATPFYQQANPGYAHSKDNEILDLVALPETFVPRTVLQATADLDTIRTRLAQKDGWDSSAFWRQVWPEHVSRGWVRMLQPTLIPPGAMHGHSCLSMNLPDLRTLARFHGLCCSVVFEYLVRVIGSDHIGSDEIGALPLPEDGDPLWDSLVVRVLRLNSLSLAYAPLWEALWSPAWQMETSIDPHLVPAYSGLEARWSRGVAVRSEYARWVTLIEVDALATMLLGLKPSDVLLSVDLHLGLLSRYERATLYDAQGRKISGEFHNRGAGQAGTAAYKAATAYMDGDQEADIDGYTPPFRRVDRTDMFDRAVQMFQASKAARG